MQLQTQLLPNQFLASLPKPSLNFPQIQTQNPSQISSISCKSFDKSHTNNRIKARSKKKENVWSVDNEIAAKDTSTNKKINSYKDRRKRGRRVVKKKKKDGLVMASAAMLMEVDTVLQTQEPVIKPAWNTFASSLSGIWKGVGAVFSPFTAEMEPIGVGSKDENLYDCYTLSRIEWSQYDGQFPKITRKTNWVTLNPFGEKLEHVNGKSDVITVNQDKISPYGSFDFEKSEVLEEDSMSAEPGLVFFEDGSYSRGPVEIPVGERDESKYFLSPTFKFEQCLVKGCHKRLRIVHTIMFNEGGSDIQIVRVAVYEEQWISPVSLYDGSNDKVDIIPISQRKRTQPSDLAGSWKVFEISATPIFEEDALTNTKQDTAGPPYVYLCTETLKKRSLPDSATYFGEEEMLDMNDVTVLWLPGGITGYVDVQEDGTLCIGVGWYSDEGINLVMERDYGIDGKLKEVRSKTEVKRMWSDPPSA